MTSPEEDARKQVPAYVALVRIGAVIGMSTALALGIFLLLIPYWVPGLLLLVAAIPCFWLMRFAEGTTKPPQAE
jgi:hypothetical protein